MGLVDFVFPIKCLDCGKRVRYICKACLNKVTKAKQVCIECKKPAIDGITHTKCKRPLGLDACTSIWKYSGVIRKSLISLKYKFAYQIAKELADYIVVFLSKKDIKLPNKAILIPIPLHKLRNNWRGFNQVEEIGKLVSQKMNWEYHPDILVRKGIKRPQAELKKDERAKNIRGVFSLNPKYKKLNLLTTNYKILLFDDVFTTGATIKEATKVLKRNKIKFVWGLTIAR